MKGLSRTLTLRTLFMVIALLLLAIPISAQDEFGGAYFLDAEGGEASEVGNGVYEFTLNGLPAGINWYLAQPMPYVGTGDGALFFQAWGTNEELSTTAFIELEDMVIEMEMSAPVFDTTLGDLTFTGEIVALDPKDPEDTKLSIPKKIDGEAKLTIVFDIMFDEAIAVGVEEVLSGTRAERSGSNNRPRPPRR